MPGVFISWSGGRSKTIAQAMKNWVKQAVQASEPWTSFDDIETGARALEAIAARLETSPIGVTCLTPENLNAPWIHFEAGALSAKKGQERVCVFLWEVALKDVPATLKQFQCVRSTKEDLQKLAVTINGAMGDLKVEDQRIRHASDAAWGEFNEVLLGLAQQRSPRPTQYPIGGAIPFVGTLNTVQPKLLDEFQAAARSKLDFLGHSLTGTFDKERGGCAAIGRALIKGTTVRVVFLDPTVAHSDQLAQVSRAMKKDLAGKIQSSIDAAREFKGGLPTFLRSLNSGITQEEVKAAQARLHLSVSALISYVNIQRADDYMLVSHYSQSHEPGRDAPTQELKLEDPFFEFYDKEFQRFWRDATPVEELDPKGLRADRARAIRHLPTLQQAYRVIIKHESEPLPFPKMFVVLPNMACTLKCANCFTWNSSRMTGKHMDEKLFASILRQAKDLNVGCVELTGGGEPLEHQAAGDLLEKAAANRSPSMRIGILSSGRPLMRNGGDKLFAPLLKLDYLRLGWTEAYDAELGKHLREFKRMLQTLGDKCQEVKSPLRIGIKLLLTSKNSQELQKVISELVTLESTNARIVKHIKVKSIRGGPAVEPDPDQIREFEHMMIGLKDRLKPHADDVQIDVKSARVDSNYKCWVSPLMTVVDALGDVYLCCNFYEHPEQSRIGTLGTEGEGKFRDIWGSEKHRRVIREVQPESVCNSHIGCNCRLVHYQAIVEPHLPYADKHLSEYEKLFDGHEHML